MKIVHIIGIIISVLFGIGSLNWLYAIFISHTFMIDWHLQDCSICFFCFIFGLVITFATRKKK